MNVAWWLMMQYTPNFGQIHYMNTCIWQHVIGLMFLRSVQSHSDWAISFPKSRVGKHTKTWKTIMPKLLSIMNPAPTFVVIAIIIMCWSYVMNVQWLQSKEKDWTDFCWRILLRDHDDFWPLNVCTFYICASLNI